MDQPAIIQMLRQLRQEQEAHDRRGEALKRAVTGLEGLLEDAGAPHSQPRKRDQPSGVGYPRGAEAVHQVLKDSRTEMDVREITDVLIRRGWTPRSADPVNATSSAAARAAEVLPDVTRRRRENGSYVYRYVDPSERAEPVFTATLNGSAPTFEEVVASHL